MVKVIQEEKLLSSLLVQWHKEPKMIRDRSQDFNLNRIKVVFPGRNITSLGTKTSKLKVTSKGSKNAFNGSTGIILNGVSPTPIPSFLDPCILTRGKKHPLPCPLGHYLAS